MTGLIVGSMLLLVLFLAVDAVTRRWTERRGLGVVCFAVAGLVLAGIGELASIPLWLVAGAAQGALLLVAYVFVLRRDMTLIPVAVATDLILAGLRDGVIQAYPGALAGSLVGVVLAGLLAVYWFRKLRIEVPDILA